MKPMKKCWCRTYQLCLKAAIPLLPYHEPRIVNSVSCLPGILKERNISSVLLITDSGIRSHGLTLPLEQQLMKNGIPCCFQEIREEDIEELAKTADHEANPLYPFPVLMDARQLQSLLRQVMAVCHGVRMEEIA